MKLTVIVGGEKGPVLRIHENTTGYINGTAYEGYRDIQMVDDSFFHHQPAEVQEFLTTFQSVAGESWDPVVFVCEVIYLHRQSRPSPKIDVEALTRMQVISIPTTPEPTIFKERDKIPVPQGYKRNRFQR